MRLLSIACAAALGLTGACEPTGQAPPSPSARGTTGGAPSASVSASPSAQRAAEYKDEDLPVAADFEELADKELNESNYLDKLGEIETEIGGGPTGADGGPSPKTGG
jgi:hypothetical protein